MSAAPPNSTRPSRWQRTRWWVLWGLVLGVTGWIIWTGRQPPLVVSPETTRITSPLLSDGRPDYAAWLNEVASRGVTPENNAVVALVRFSGTGVLFERGTLEEDVEVSVFLQRLGIPAPAESNLCVPLDKLLESDQRQLVQGIREDPDTFQPSQHAKVVQWIAANDRQLTAFSADLRKCDRYYFPIVHSVKQLPPQGLLWERYIPVDLFADVTSLLRLRASQRRQSDDLDGAIDDAFTLLWLGRLVSRDVWSWSRWQQSGIENSGLNTLRDVLFSDELTAAHIDRIQQELAALPANGSLADIYELGERAAVLDFTCALRTAPDSPLFDQFIFSGTSAGTGIFWQRAGIELGRGEDINVLLRQVNLEYDRRRNALRLADPQARAAAVKDLYLSHTVLQDSVLLSINEELRRTLKMPTQKLDVTKRNFAAVRDEAEGRMYQFQLDEQSRFRVELVEVALALASFRLRHGRHPVALEELVPNFFDAIPQDPWTGNPLLYVPGGRGFSIYSAGINQTDELGWGVGETGSNGDDIRFGLNPDDNPGFPAK